MNIFKINKSSKFWFKIFFNNFPKSYDLERGYTRPISSIYPSDGKFAKRIGLRFKYGDYGCPDKRNDDFHICTNPLSYRRPNCVLNGWKSKVSPLSPLRLRYTIYKGFYVCSEYICNTYIMYNIKKRKDQQLVQKVQFVNHL